MEDTPICVIFDGDGEFPDDLGRHVLVVRREEVEPPELRRLSFGSVKAKNTALWASPFETFLLLDADTIVWGDMRVHADFECFDFILDRGGIEPPRFVMDVDLVETHFPEFDARRNLPDFVNSGVYFGRRGALDLDRYLDLLRLAREVPGLFYGSQGAFNFMLFSAADEGRVRVHQRELQVLTGRTLRADVVGRFGFADSKPLVLGDPVALHWVESPKPRVRQRGRDYFMPMTYFRHEFRRLTRDRATHPVGDIWLRLEDAACADRRGSNLRGQLAQLGRRSRQCRSELRVFLRRSLPDRLVAAARRADR